MSNQVHSHVPLVYFYPTPDSGITMTHDPMYNGHQHQNYTMRHESISPRMSAHDLEDFRHQLPPTTAAATTRPLSQPLSSPSPGSTPTAQHDHHALEAREGGFSDRKSSASVGDSVEERLADKRRRNTLAARKHRRKVHDRVATLELALDMMTKERDELKMQVARWEGESCALRKLLARGRTKTLT